LVAGLLLDWGSFSNPWSDSLQDDFENLKRVGILGSGSSKANRVSSGEGNLTLSTNDINFQWGVTNLIRGKTWLFVNCDFKHSTGMLDADDGWAPKVTIRVITMSKCQAINAPVTLVVCGSVVQEASNATSLNKSQQGQVLVEWVPYLAAMCIYNKSKPIPLTSSVNARGADLGFPILRIP
jgi:hypothetical protein